MSVEAASTRSLESIEYALMTENGLVSPEPVHQNFDPSSARRHEAFLRRRAKSPPSHPLQERRGVLAAGIGEEGFAAGSEEGRDQGRQSRDVPLLVEHVGGKDEVERARRSRFGRVPVEEMRFGLETQVDAGVVAGEVEGGHVMVGGGDCCGSTCEGDHAREPYAAAELDDAPVREALFRDVPRECHSTRPELGPVGEPLVLGEVFLVDQGVHSRRMRDTVRSTSDLDEGFDQFGAVAKVR